MDQEHGVRREPVASSELVAQWVRVEQTAARSLCHVWLELPGHAPRLMASHSVVSRAEAEAVSWRELLVTVVEATRAADTSGSQH